MTQNEKYQGMFFSFYLFWVLSWNKLQFFCIGWNGFPSSVDSGTSIRQKTEEQKNSIYGSTFPLK